MNMNTLFASLFLLLALVLSGCYQAHSDDGLRTVPTTNNPNVIQDAKRSSLPGSAF